MSPRVVEVRYHADTARVFDAFADRPWAVFLDSAGTGGDNGRFDLIAAEPVATLVTRGMQTEVRRAHADGGELIFVRSVADDPLDLLRDALGTRGAPARAPDGTRLPFASGAIGYCGYELGHRLAGLPVRVAALGDPPDMAFGIYPWALIADHRARRSYLLMDATCSEGQGRTLAAIFADPPSAQPRVAFALRAPWVSNFTVDSYAEAFARVRDYIHAGDCYQLNLAQRFSAPATGDAWLAYQALRRTSAAPFAAYLHLPELQVLSLSPERFVAVTDEQVRAEPIKGTRPRSTDSTRNKAQRRALQESVKDRAENVMIVDLLRNDLSKVCRPHSVEVPRLCAVESFAAVHHLVSTITGQLRAECDALDVLRACFPGGSITGAPKRRTMQLIAALEPHRRGVYCGAIGYLSRDGGMDLNIAIRTLVYDGRRICGWAGGGIVADSTCAEEYLETFDKVRPLLQTLSGGAALPGDPANNGA